MKSIRFAVAFMFLTCAAGGANANDFEIDSFPGNGQISWIDTNTNGH